MWKLREGHRGTDGRGMTLQVSIRVRIRPRGLVGMVRLLALLRMSRLAIWIVQFGYVESSVALAPWERLGDLTYETGE